MRTNDIIWKFLVWCWKMSFYLGLGQWQTNSTWTELFTAIKPLFYCEIFEIFGYGQVSLKLRYACSFLLFIMFLIFNKNMVIFPALIRYFERFIFRSHRVNFAPMAHTIYCRVQKTNCHQPSTRHPRLDFPVRLCDFGLCGLRQKNVSAKFDSWIPKPKQVDHRFIWMLKLEKKVATDVKFYNFYIWFISFLHSTCFSSVRSNYLWTRHTMYMWYHWMECFTWTWWSVFFRSGTLNRKLRSSKIVGKHYINCFYMIYIKRDASS